MCSLYMIVVCELKTTHRAKCEVSGFFKAYSGADGSCNDGGIDQQYVWQNFVSGLSPYCQTMVLIAFMQYFLLQRPKISTWYCHSASFTFSLYLSHDSNYMRCLIGDWHSELSNSSSLFMTVIMCSVWLVIDIWSGLVLF